MKSVECVRLLTLHHLAFPVDTNVRRIAVRLGWVPLQPLPESLQLHLLEMYPVLDSIQKYLWPKLCKLDQLTFARLALPGPEEKKIEASNAPIPTDPAPHVVNMPMSLPEAENKSEGGFEKKCEPIIEEPTTPQPEATELFSETDAGDVNIEEDMDMDTSGQSLNIVPVSEQQNEEEEGEEEYRRINKKTNKRKKNKIDLKKRRQSLAGAGSSWTSSGVRRSIRIKRRPLEYWKGERLLYAQVHNSLPTVIGVKYISPTSKEEGGFKVESFVSDKYKHLVELTALH
ncbi:hypothetical protein Lser_V15G43151 [Lactuca serriola]